MVLGNSYFFYNMAIYFWVENKYHIFKDDKNFIVKSHVSKSEFYFLLT